MIRILPALLLALPLSATAQQPMIEQPIDLLSAYEPASGDRWKKVHIETAGQWVAKRADIRRRVLDIMGEFPANQPPLAPEILSKEDQGRYTRMKVRYAGEIPAWLLVPKGKGPFPALLASHQTNNAGKDAVIGLVGVRYEQYGRELVERGFVVLAPDSITAGERVLSKPYVTEPFDRAHPEWSAMGKMLADHRRGIDYLVSLPFVDARRIGAIGHSLGAYNTFFLAAFDERVRAAVSSCGFAPLNGSTKPFAWSRTTWFVHFPRLAPYLRSGIIPFDMHEVMALVAPRALFNFSAANDAIMPDAAAIRAAGEQVAALYRQLGAGDRFVFRMEPGPHDFPDAIRKEAYAWLERELAAR